MRNQPFQNDCSNQSSCNDCKKEEHNPGDEACDEYLEPIPNVVPFAGASDVISNFFPCELKAFGVPPLELKRTTFFYIFPAKWVTFRCVKS